MIFSWRAFNHFQDLLQLQQIHESNFECLAEEAIVYEEKLEDENKEKEELNSSRSRRVIISRKNLFLHQKF